MKKRYQGWMIAVVLVLALGSACSPGGGDQAATPAPADDSGQAPDDANTESSPEPDIAAEEAAPPAEPVLASLGLPVISLTTASEGVGPKPLFEWEAIDGAETYSLVVKTQDGESYWAWSGPETSIYMGGLADAPDDNAGGPILFEPMRWAVLAFDADGALIATSPEQPIAP